MVPEASLKQMAGGLAAEGEGWFVIHARDARWWQREGLGRSCDFEGDADFAELGFRLTVLEPGQPSGMYHGESGQEDFLVVAGECILIVEGQERRLKQWDFVHCPPWTEHIFVGAGEGSCVIVMAGGRTAGTGLLYPVNETAARHGASVEMETPSPKEAYAPYPREPNWSPYRDGDLPTL